jgi:4-hydroxybenzoate polyprenyltransferase
VLEGLRPSHWIKNVFVFAAMPFGGKFFDPEAWLVCGGLFLIFCGLASGVYLINDVRDRDADRIHPEKGKRAVASGRFPVRTAVFLSTSLLAFSLGAAFMLDFLQGGRLPLLSVCGAAYVTLNLLYTFWIKGVPILDIISIALGFVIRAVAGALAIAVPVSPWLVICTFMLSLFIGITKRRAEVNDCTSDMAVQIRRTNAFYTHERLEHMLSVAASLAIMSYSLYCIAPQTQERVGSFHLAWTIPVVVYGIFRYYCLSGISGQGDPVRVLVKDRAMWFTGVAWIIVVVLVLYAHV